MIQPRDNPDDPSSESMRYGMLGCDGATPLEKLDKYTGEVSWSYLSAHFESGALLFVDPSLDLEKVGRALAEDDVDLVQKWQNSGDLLKPSQPHADFWEETGAKFLAAVVMPFVLIQPAPSDGE